MSSSAKELVSTSIKQKSIKHKCGAFRKCVGFIDETVLAVTRPDGYRYQLVVYNGRKRKHSPLLQAVSTPDCLVQHVLWPKVGRRNYCTLYIQSNLEEDLPNLLEVDGERFCICGHSGNNRWWYREVPSKRSVTSAPKVLFNVFMSKLRATVEWIFEEL